MTRRAAGWPIGLASIALLLLGQAESTACGSGQENREDRMRPIDVREATRIAAEAIAEIDSGHDMMIRPEQTQEHEFGWAFLYAPKRFIETGDVQYEVPGNGPVIVERDGKVTFISSSGPPDVGIQRFLEAWRDARR